MMLSEDVLSKALDAVDAEKYTEASLLIRENMSSKNTHYLWAKIILTDNVSAARVFVGDGIKCPSDLLSSSALRPVMRVIATEQTPNQDMVAALIKTHNFSSALSLWLSSDIALDEVSEERLGYFFAHNWLESVSQSLWRSEGEVPNDASYLSFFDPKTSYEDKLRNLVEKNMLDDIAEKIRRDVDQKAKDHYLRDEQKSFISDRLDFLLLTAKTLDLGREVPRRKI